MQRYFLFMRLVGQTRVKILLLAIIFVFADISLSAQKYHDAYVVEENRMSPSSAVFPFSSEEAALVGNYSEASDYIIPLTEWKRSELENGVLYTTKFKVPYRWSDRVVLLRMEGVSNSFAVQVNEKYVGYAQAGMGRVQFDLTKLSQENYNDLAVTIYNDTAAEEVENSREHDDLIITRAFIISQPKVRIKDLYVDAVYEDGIGLFNLSAVMESHLINSKEFKIYYELLAPSGEKVAYGDKVLNTQMYSRDSVYFFARIPQVQSWTHERPVLYTLLVKTQYEGRFKEYVVSKVGFTDFSFDVDGSFYVNGYEVPLVPASASWKGNYKATETFLRKLKSDGATVVMTEGHPQPDEFYLLCDRIGLYVCDQADIDTSKSGNSRAVGGNPSNAPEWTDAFVSRVEDMYLSSKNHPSVIAFSLANEDSANGIALYEAYLKLKGLENGRPVYYASVDGEWNSDNIKFCEQSQQTSWQGIELITERAGEGVVELKNKSNIIPFYGKAEYITRNGVVKYGISEQELVIAPGETIRCDVSFEKMTPGKKKNSLEIKVYDFNSVQEYDVKETEYAPAIILQKRIGFYNSVK